jgi:uncharacterized membrane protein YczE
MKATLLIQLATLVVISPILLIFNGIQQAASFSIGAAMVLINLTVLTWTWSRILKKKQIAIATTIIVFKYGIFAAMIYWVLQDPLTHAGWFCVGLSTLLTTVLLTAMINVMEKNKEDKKETEA